MLDLVYYTVQKVIAEQDYDQEKGCVLNWDQDWDWKARVDHAELKDHALMMLEVATSSIDERVAMYKIHIQLFGTVLLNDWEKQGADEQRKFELQCRSMLIGMVRERIRMLTSDGPWGQIVMPLLPLKSTS